MCKSTLSFGFALISFSTWQSVGIDCLHSYAHLKARRDNNQVILKPAFITSETKFEFTWPRKSCLFECIKIVPVFTARVWLLRLACCRLRSYASLSQLQQCPWTKRWDECPNSLNPQSSHSHNVVCCLFLSHFRFDAEGHRRRYFL